MDTSSSPPAAPSDDKVDDKVDAIDDLLDAFQELAPSEVEEKKKKKVLKKKVSVRGHIPKRRTSGSSSWLKSSSVVEKKTSPVTATKKKKTKKKKEADPYTIPKSLKAKFSPQEMNTRQTHFKQMSDKDNRVQVSKLKKLLGSFGETYSEKRIKDVIQALEISTSSVSFTEFLKLSDKIASSSTKMTHSVKGSTVHVSNEHGAKHQFSKEETAAFARHINQTLSRMLPHPLTANQNTNTHTRTHDIQMTHFSSVNIYLLIQTRWICSFMFEMEFCSQNSSMRQLLIRWTCEL